MNEEETFEKIIEGSGSFFQGDMQRRCHAIVNSTARTRSKVEDLLQLIAQAGDFIAPYVVCKEGCHHCCHMAVAISGFEAMEIGKHIKIVPEQVTINVEEALACGSPEAYQRKIADKHTGVTCPFLIDQKCSIYEVRPIACRTYFNLSGNASFCDLTLGGHDVPNVDLRLIAMAQVEILIQYDLGDIREFFPDVSKWTKYCLTNKELGTTLSSS